MIPRRVRKRGIYWEACVGTYKTEYSSYLYKTWDDAMLGIERSFNTSPTAWALGEQYRKFLQSELDKHGTSLYSSNSE
jgi:hypothetical protein